MFTNSQNIFSQENYNTCSREVKNILATRIIIYHCQLLEYFGYKIYTLEFMCSSTLEIFLARRIITYTLESLKIFLARRIITYVLETIIIILATRFTL